MNDKKFYRGYIATNNKAPVQAFRGVKLPERESVQHLPEYAGVLKENSCIVDFDDKEQAEIALKIMNKKYSDFIVLKTTRGYHFLFTVPSVYDDLIDNKSHIKLACGLEADIKRGPNALQVFKYDGKEREFVCDCEEIPELPYFFLPVQTKEAPQLLGLREGDGRNDTLFRYEINCFMSGLSQPDIKDLYENILNEFIFTDKLTPKELEAITREEALKGALEKSLVSGKQANVTTIADIMIQHDNIININNVVHIYTENGVYSSNRLDIERVMLSYVSTLKINARNEIYQLLRIKAPQREYSDKRYILFKNGVYDIDTDTLLDHSPAFVIPNLIPHNYNEEAQGEEIKKALNDWACGDEQLVNLLKEIIGYSMLRSNPFRKMFIVTGSGRNGKSKFLDVLERLMGSENTTRVPLKNMGKQFANSSIENKLLNLGDDIEKDSIIETADLKKFVSGDALMVESKGKDARVIKPYATLIFTANKIPYIADDTGAIKGRTVVVPFNANYPEGTSRDDIDIIAKLTTEDNMEALIQRGLDGLADLFENNSFSIPDAVKKAERDYLLEADPISQFIEEYKDNIIGRTNNDVYTDFLEFCRVNDIKRKFTLTQLTRRIVDLLNCKTEAKDGKRYYKPK